MDTLEIYEGDILSYKRIFWSNKGNERDNSGHFTQADKLFNWQQPNRLYKLQSMLNKKTATAAKPTTAEMTFSTTLNLSSFTKYWEPR